VTADALPKPAAIPQRPEAPAEPTRAELRRFFASHPLNNVIVISNHAVDRYRKRFRPQLDNEEARVEVYASMRKRGLFTPIPPQWLFFTPSVKQVSRANIGYVVIDDDLAMPLRLNTPRKKLTDRRPQPYVAVTCLYRVQL
jgi:hypothetical protein